MHPLHQRALSAAKKLFEAEGELLTILQEIDHERLFLDLGYASLFRYCVEGLNLSEANTSNFIVVARRSREIPELKEGVALGRFSLAKARKIAPVITPANREYWLSKAETLPKEKLEQEVARVRPEMAGPDHARHLDGEFADLKVKVPVRFLEKLRQCQDIVCQRIQSTAGFGDVLENAMDLLLCDATAPVHRTRKFYVLLRDRHQCTFIANDGKRCNATRWLDVHHVIPKSEGGTDEMENLVTLCSGHHRLLHEVN